MLKIGLTGGIGSGKSMVAGILQVFGIPVFDADKQAKLLMESDAELRSAIIAEFGIEAYVESKLNRAYIASQVFNNDYKLEKLNAIVHPATIAAAKRWMHQQKAPYAVKEAALLFEAGSANDLDYIIGVFAPAPVRIQRVMTRDGLLNEEVQARMKRQISEEIKMKLCDFVLVNDEQRLLIPQVLSLHQKLVDISCASAAIR